MSSKMVTDRQKASLFVQAAIQKHASGLSRRYQELMEPHLKESEASVGLELEILLAGRRLATATEAMVQADAAHEAELGDDVAQRRKREESTQDLREAVLLLRRRARSFYDPEDEALVLGIQGETALDPVVLLRQVKTLREFLSRPVESFPPLIDPEMPADPGSWVSRLDEPEQRLQEALAQLATEAQEQGQTQEAKNAAIGTYDAIFLRTARFLEALFELVGQPELAARVRPSSQKPGETDIPVEDNPSETEAG